MHYTDLKGAELALRYSNGDLHSQQDATQKNDSVGDCLK